MFNFDPNQAIAVDLDGTLIHECTGRYSFKQLCLKMPWMAPMVPFWLTRGSAFTKRQIAKYITIDPKRLKYNQWVLDFVKEYRQKGHHLILATGSDQKYADAIANYLGLFDQVIASNGQINKVSEQKAKHLVALFGEKNFIYLGNSSQDLAVWQKAAYAIAVNTPARVIKKLSELGTPYTVM